MNRAHQLRTHDCTAYRHGLVFRAARCFHIRFFRTQAHQLSRNMCQLLNMFTEAHVCTCPACAHGCRFSGEVVAIKSVDACNSADLVPYLQHEATVLSGACVVAVVACALNHDSCARLHQCMRRPDCPAVTALFLGRRCLALGMPLAQSVVLAGAMCVSVQTSVYVWCCDRAQTAWPAWQAPASPPCTRPATGRVGCCSCWLPHASVGRTPPLAHATLLRWLLPWRWVGRGSCPLPCPLQSAIRVCSASGVVVLRGVIPVPTHPPTHPPCVRLVSGAAVCACCVQALRAIHAKGVAHGDICEDNIIVADDGKVRLFRVLVSGLRVEG